MGRALGMIAPSAATSTTASARAVSSRDGCPCRTAPHRGTSARAGLDVADELLLFLPGTR
jgi:hypothetical protein